MGIPASRANDRTPQLVVGVDLRSLPIGPREAFVLSRVDGASTIGEIALATGLDEAAVVRALDQLSEQGAVTYPGQPDVPKSEPAPVTPRDRPRLNHPGAETQRLARPAVESIDQSTADHHPSASLYDPSELDEDCDLELARKRTILDIYYQLDEFDHYELLGVRQEAEKQEIKTAYFEVVSLFHPDKYFGKRLGSFKSKLERVFARLTEAHDALTRKRTRQEYDDYLRNRQRTRAFDRFLKGESGHAAEVERARRRIIEEARAAERLERGAHRAAVGAPAAPDRADARAPAARAPETVTKTVAEPRDADAGPSEGGQRAAPAARTSADSASERESTPPRPSVPPPDPAARRRALARKLGGGSVPPPPPEPVEAPRQSPSTARHQVADELRRIYTSRVTRARDDQVQQYLDAADLATKETNTVSAANALRVALSLAPDREDIKHRLAAAEQAANISMADSFLEQAQYEEQEQRWEAAARSYQRAALGKPSARLHERAAYCLLAANGDTKVALEHARAAVNQAPSLPSMRVTLARVYLAAGMRQSAVAEFERAQALAPQDDTIKGWLKRIRRNQI